MWHEHAALKHDCSEVGFKCDVTVCDIISYFVTHFECKSFYNRLSHTACFIPKYIYI